MDESQDLERRKESKKTPQAAVLIYWPARALSNKLIDQTIRQDHSLLISTVIHAINALQVRSNMDSMGCLANKYSGEVLVAEAAAAAAPGVEARPH